MRRLTTFLIVAALAATGGCGTDDQTEGPGGSQAQREGARQSEQSPETIPAVDVDRVKEAQESIDTACGLTRGEEGSDVPLEDAIRTLQDVYRTYPEGIYAAPTSTEQRSMDEVVKDAAKQLRGCGKSAEAAELERVLKEQ